MAFTGFANTMRASRFVALIDNSMRCGQMGGVTSIPSDVDAFCQTLAALHAEHHVVLGLVHIAECDALVLAECLRAEGWSTTYANGFRAIAESDDAKHQLAQAASPTLECPHCDVEIRTTDDDTLRIDGERVCERCYASKGMTRDEERELLRSIKAPDGWTFDVDRMSGAWCFTHVRNEELRVYCTPDWECTSSRGGVIVTGVVLEDDHIDSDEIAWPRAIRSGITFLEAMRDTLADAERMYAPPKIDLCTRCGNPTHASESSDDGVCVACLGADAIEAST